MPNQMKLDDFVEQALAQIIEGIGKAQAATAGCGSIINPAVHGNIAHELKKLHDVQTGLLVETVTFDVAVQANTSTGTSGGIGVIAGAIALGSKGQSAYEDSTVSRLRFSIPVIFPKGTR